MSQENSLTKQEPSETSQENESPIIEEAKPQTTSVDLQKQLNLEPTTIVLAKVKGYRAWPAMVMDEAILPENIRKVKPKSIRLARKPTKPVIVVPVRFFSDDTYIWIKSCDLKVLPAADIEAFLVKRANAKKHDTLIDAYKLAQDPPDMREFNTWGSRGPPQHSESAEESDIGDDLEPTGPEPKKLKLTIKLKKPSSSASRSKASGKLQGPKNGANGAKKEPVSEESTPPSDALEGFDSDWGLEEAEYDIQGGNYIFDDEQQQKEFSELFPRAADLYLTLEQFEEIFRDFHQALSPGLLLGEIDNEKKVVGKLRELERLIIKSDTPMIAFTKSPLFRVLLLTMHRPADRFAHQAVRDAIQQVLSQLDLHTCQISEDDMELKTKDSTPHASEGQGDAEVVVVE
ncbi:Tudor/PWWP/MBT [Metschnikowia bicuspidata var. bicuspidata NRRL YB-4993]|uniref:Tudor/PWWP/MBT n=1 Tax=Metschnikowia bicuspidata var. bicuspidata NRRL YB-4993 TaxID=869754 RepID=A0A1A0H9Y0_9ASCO|nr:Tudor/PWWP/MBT [Metschnikowia bicuspidata var. bicuspidata NRRL YB-4993]OBA20678.1 Tudor/PWWP/MBT [Metschnikowia bicuspidata var. bicuspidata NRRL YB-4993]